MTEEQFIYLEKVHRRLLRVATDYFNAEIRFAQYPGNDSYKKDMINKKKKLKDLVKEENISNSKKQREISFQ